MFLAAKLAELLVMPATLAAVLAATGLGVSFRSPRAGRWLIGAGVVLLWGFGSPGLAARVLAPLERAYPRPPETVHAEAVVVLCGTTDVALSTPDRIEFGDGPERIIEGARLVKEGRARRLIITGGSGDPLYPAAREADLLARFARDYGVAPSAILTESASKTTAENAAFTAKLLKDKGIRTLFLVTSAYHLPRAMACFRKVGVHPVPFPVDFQVTPDRARLLPYVPTSRGLALSTSALHEYLGLAVYWVGGRL